MPSLLTHNYFARDFLASINNGLGLLDFPSSFRLGNQGPDPLFFSGMMPFKDLSIKTIKGEYGSKLHRLNGYKLFEELFKQLDNIEDNKSKRVFFSFIIGQLGHYFLDSTCHPYIYYFSGFNSEGSLKGIFHYSHAHFEGRIDSALANIRNEKEICTHPQDILKIDDEQLEIINANFNTVIEKVFSTKIKQKYYYNGVKNMISIYTFVNKNEFIGSHLGKNPLGQLFIPRNEDEKVLNPLHYKWQNPVSGKEYKSSFLELFLKAMNNYKATLTKLDFSNPKFDSIKDCFSNINYSGVVIGKKMTYQDFENKLVDFNLQRK